MSSAVKKENKLIILRGPAGSGKTVVAKRLQKTLPARVAILTPDYFYWQVFPGEDNKELVNKILAFTIKSYIDEDYTVILEGILPLSENRSLIEEIIKFCKKKRISYLPFFLNVSLETALKRNKMRKNEKKIKTEDIKNWFTVAKKGAIEGEKIIQIDNMSIEEVTALIRKSLI